MRERASRRYTSLMANVLLLATVLLLTSATVRADIYEWRDENGNRHFTNSLVNVPKAQRDDAQVIVTATTPTDASPAPAVVAAVPAPRTEAQVVYDYSRTPDPYTQGVEDGIALARSVAPAHDGDVYINGPLAVASSDPYVSMPAAYPYYYYPQYPLVTTSFDRGRSRHLTLRMLLQDQFQFDRDGPYVYQRSLPPPAGPNLRTVLPRGLPHDRVRNVGPLSARVTTR